MNFHVGQKVVCVDGHAPFLRKGEIYTIESLALDIYPSGDFFKVNAWQDGSNNWFRRRFRPLVTRKASIEQFHEIRRDVERTVRVPFVKEAVK